MNNLRDIGDVVTFGRRRGYVVGYSTFSRHNDNDTNTYLIVELDAESASYLEPREGFSRHDCFISLMVVHPGSIGDTPVTQNQRVILEDCLTTAKNFKTTFGIKDKDLREDEQNELLARIVDDIKTVLRLER